MATQQHLNTDYFARDASKVGDGSQTQEGYLEVLPNRLYWTCLSGIPKNTSTHHFFSIDNELVYEPFFADFGPLNLSSTYRYCKLVKAILDDPQLANKKIVHYCSQDPKKRPNAAYLIGAFQVMVLKRTAEIAYRPFNNIRPPFLPFRDATCGVCNYHCTVLDCLKGLEYAMRIRWFDPNTFDVAAYEFYEKVEHGDMNWVMPDKFLAFAGPSATPIDPDGFPAFTPEDYVPMFKSANVNMVVRLNKKQYDRRRFTDHGIKHVDLYFLDGSCPSREIIQKFLYVAESEPGAIAIHCKAGLGRTGTLIGLYAQKHFQFPGRAYIGWNRICRPGAILGPQQQFLTEMQNEMIQQGIAHRANLMGQPRNQEELQLRRELEEAERREDVGQGDRLTAAKRDMYPGFGGLKMGGFSSGKLMGRPPKPLRGMFGPQPPAMLSPA
ncbi:unnamed protein product [Amoebophrya sp. A120]|nr:unnamed protein product [Amoebophrya sp. A120]|eukprot:GSA120T00004910001.1